MIRPLTSVTGDDEKQRPFLGNTSMESYERSNCTGCHSKGYATPFFLLSDPTHQDTLTIVNDLMYWLILEVPAANNQ